jgi:RecB family exonuclease
VKYWFTYHDARGKLYLKSKSVFSFGLSLHKVLERFHDASQTGVTTTEEALAALEEDWISAGYESQEEMADSYGEGKEIITRYVEATQQKSVVGKTLFTEKQVRTDYGDFVLVGRIDRIDEIRPNEWVVIDYKSGRSEVTEEDVRNEVAMGLYQLILSRLYPEKNVQLRIIALRSGAEATAQLTNSELLSLENDVRQLAQLMLNMDAETYVPEWKPICERCDFRPLCNQHPSYADSVPVNTAG